MPSAIKPSQPNEPRANSAVHYENDVEFFQAFLDPYMKYGSGYFAPGDGFETASVRMLDRALADAGLPLQTGTARILDVGSGWGSVRRRLVEREIPMEYHQINPSQVQRAFIEEMFGPAASTHCCGLESAQLPDRYFDAIFMHDSFCHLDDKPAMLRKLARALKPNGRLVLQDTFYANSEFRDKAVDAMTTREIQEDLFGFAQIVPLDTFTQQLGAAGLSLRVLEDVSMHYKRTVAVWLHRLASVDSSRFPLKDACLRSLRRGAACMGYSTTHYFLVLSHQNGSLGGLNATLRKLRSSMRKDSAEVPSNRGVDQP